MWAVGCVIFLVPVNADLKLCYCANCIIAFSSEHSSFVFFLFRRCIMGELLRNKPLLPGSNELEQVCIRTYSSFTWSRSTSAIDHFLVYFDQDENDMQPPGFTERKDLARFLLSAECQKINSSESGSLSSCHH